MKNVVKISISGLAFTLEEDGYMLLDKYLSQLRKYYNKQKNGVEVVEGIEERIAELLRERMGTSEEVVSKELVQEVMAIMGKPEDIEGENIGEDEREYFRSTGYGVKPKRRLYRNVDDRILGGVCSGLAAYCNLEPLLFRIIFVLLTIFSSWTLFRFHYHSFNFSFGGWVVLTYIVLWIVIPAAKTVAQKCEMRGERPDFSGIQDRVKRGVENFEREVRSVGQRVSRTVEGNRGEFAHGLGRVIEFCVGVLLLMIAIPVLISLPISMVFSLSWFHGILPKGIDSLVAFHGSFLWIQILLALVILLPFVGMLYGGIRLIFNLKQQRIRPGFIIFVGWLISLMALLVLFVVAARPYYGGIEEAHEEVPIQMLSDTLYVHYTTPAELPVKDLWMEANASEANLVWFEGEKHSLQAIVYPRIRIVRVDAQQQMRVIFRGKAAGRYAEESFRRAEESIPGYRLQDSLITLLPEVYSSMNPWQGNASEVVIYLPQGKQVVLTSPYRHHFDRSAPGISNGAAWRNRHFGSVRPYGNSRLDDKWDRWERRWERKWERLERRWAH